MSGIEDNFIPEPGPLAEILDDLAVFVPRFVVLSSEQSDTWALYVVHTHSFPAADTTPYIEITSPEKRSGKTRLLEVSDLVVREPLHVANISDAALFRVILKLQGPTLLFDEVDAIFSPKAQNKDDLRGMLNAGYRQGAMVWRNGGQNNRDPEPYPVFCPKMFAGIGELPDTIGDRSIPFRLQRRTRDEKIERFRRRDVAPEAAMLHDRAAAWAEAHLDELRKIRPELPDELDDRAQDGWEPLLAIADMAGGDWPDRAKSAALALSAGDERENDSIRVQLLTDIQQVFSLNGTERYCTTDLIAELSKIEESPWGDWYGKPITPHQLSKHLQPYRIKTLPVWVDGKTVRGYKREQFADAFAPVLGVRSVRTVRSGSSTDAAPNASNAPNAGGTEEEGSVPLSTNEADEAEVERLAEKMRDAEEAVTVTAADDDGHRNGRNPWDGPIVSHNGGESR